MKVRNMSGCGLQRVCHACLAVGFAAWASACGPRGSAPRLASTTQVYRCADETTFVARFEPERAWLFLEGAAVSVAQVPAVSALHYSNGTVTLTGTATMVRLTHSRGSHHGCVAQPDEVPWADARLRGIDVRAAGRDPEWVLEIREGRDAVLTGAPADARRSAAFPHTGLASPMTESSFDVHSPEGGWRVTLDRSACLGSAPAGAAAVGVRVDVDGRTLTGCGRFLR